MKWLRMGSAGLLLFAFTACESLDDLGDIAVENQNNPDTERALASAGDVESLIGGAFAVWHDANSWGYPNMAMSMAADEGTLSWGNFGSQQLSSEPRVAWPNSISWTYRNLVEYPWFNNYAAISAVYDGIRALDENPDFANDIDVGRARAMAKFVQGLGLGFVALMYDSAFILVETVDLATDVLELAPYPTVMAQALTSLDEALAAANGGIDDMQTSWFSGNPFTQAEFIQLVNSHYARMLAQVARTPAERAAANWNEIYSRADAGITADLVFDGDGNDIWWPAMVWYGANSASTTWTRADYKTIGQTEITVGTQSGGASGYVAWLATPVAQRNEFNLDVFDERIHPPGDPMGRGLDFQHHGPSRFRAARGTYHFSFYMHHKYEDYPAGGGVDPWVYMNVEEMDMLKAEAAIRAGAGGGVAEAVTLINATRVGRGNLPAVDAGMTTQQLMDAMIYEKRIENFFICSGCPYFDRRGWGDLSPTGPNHHQGPVEGTPAHFPLPGLELETLQLPIYTYGGVGSEGGTLAPSAAPGVRGSLSVTRAPASHVYQFNGLTIQEMLDRIHQGRALKGVSALTRH